MSLHEKVVVSQFAQANKRILAGDHPELDTMQTQNNSEMKKETVESTLHRNAQVYYFVEMWQGSQNLSARQKESCPQNMQMTAIGYIPDTEEIVIASWSLSQHDGAATLQLSERSPLSPALSAKDFPGGQTQLLNVCRLRTTNHHPVNSPDDSTPPSISETES